MKHVDLMSERNQPDKRDLDPQCDGECKAVSSGFWDDVRWTIYVCQKCNTPIAAVGGGAHWWNYVISQASRERLGV